MRQAIVPGVFIGLNLATFYAGATNNSVANAALIGSLSPFVILPIGARLFREYVNPRALVFAVHRLRRRRPGPLQRVPAPGNASLRGNVFGLVAMLLWTAYIVSTRHFRGHMDVATFMATVSPHRRGGGAAHRHRRRRRFGLSRTGWTYMLVLALLTGVAAHGLNVYAQKAIPIGTIGIAQVAQPALAVVWSFLLLGETVRGWQGSDRRRAHPGSGLPRAHRTGQPCRLAADPTPKWCR